MRESGHPWDLVCATDRTDELIRSQELDGFTFDSTTPKLVSLAAALRKPNFPLSASIAARQCPSGVGQKNRLGLTQSGVIAIKEMMHLGMLIDIDHMSQAAADQALQMAAYAGYPVNSGHNAVRGTWQNHYERALRQDQYAIIGRLHGMAGVGSARVDASQWVVLYNQVIQAMGGGNIAGGFGTDTNGLELGMKPSDGARERVLYSSSFPASTDGNKTWFYDRDGVAHYGMLWDFVEDLKKMRIGCSLNNGLASVCDGKATVESLMTGADYLFRTWQIAEIQAPKVR